MSLDKIAINLATVVIWCLPALGLWAQPGTSHSGLASADWSATAEHNLVSNRPSKSAVELFLAPFVLPPRTVERIKKELIKKSADRKMYIRLCDFRFADLRHSGKLSLVVSFGGRYCNEIDVIDKTAQGFEVHEIWLPGESVETAVQDINGDGHLELIGNEPVSSSYPPYQCTAERSIVYGWTGNGYADVSEKYRNFYREDLADLRRQITAREKSANGASSVAPDDPNAFDCDRIAAAMDEEFLGIQSDATLKDAIKLAHSGNHYARETAAYMLSYMHAPEAKKYLQDLSADRNKAVAGEAQGALEDFRSSPLPYEPRPVEPIPVRNLATNGQ